MHVQCFVFLDSYGWIIPILMHAMVNINLFWLCFIWPSSSRMVVLICIVYKNYSHIHCWFLISCLWWSLYFLIGITSSRVTKNVLPFILTNINIYIYNKWFHYVSFVFWKFQSIHVTSITCFESLIKLFVTVYLFIFWICICCADILNY